jgi:hypothetical protein
MERAGRIGKCPECGKLFRVMIDEPGECGCGWSEVPAVLTFKEWYEQNEEELFIEFAETGADRELDHDPERICSDRYEEYLKKQEGAA